MTTPDSHRRNSGNIKLTGRHNVKPEAVCTIPNCHYGKVSMLESRLFHYYDL